MLTYHFAGNPNQTENSIESVLLDLKCRTLTDYRWYRDTFLSYVLQRKDCSEIFWKERFISGLPKLFGSRIFRKINTNPGKELKEQTFGELFALVRQEGLAICEELKIGDFQHSFINDNESIFEAISIVNYLNLGYLGTDIHGSVISTD